MSFGVTACGTSSVDGGVDVGRFGVAACNPFVGGDVDVGAFGVAACNTSSVGGGVDVGTFGVTACNTSCL